MFYLLRVNTQKCEFVGDEVLHPSNKNQLYINYPIQRGIITDWNYVEFVTI